ncbi:MAG: hypothetical protein ACYCPT_08045 [Acidimicrobiales bacterium]
MALVEVRVLVTNSVVDFEIIRRQREANALRVPGLVYTSDESFPRSRAFVNHVGDALEDAARRRLVEPDGGVYWLRVLKKQFTST